MTQDATNSGDEGQEQDSAAPARILVIDDEEVVHVSLRRMLGRRGHQVETVFSAQEGLDRLEGGAFDLVITDLMMPEMDGIGLLKQLNRRKLSVAVLMITGYPTIRTALQALRLGAMDYLAKPFTRVELLGPVNRALRRTAEADAPASDEGLRPDDPTSDDGIESPEVGLSPGDRVCLPRHAWAVYRQDGAMDVGIEPSFLGSIGQLTSISVPQEAELVEQGFVGFRLGNAAGEEHGVLMPVSGPVTAVNVAATADPKAINADTWLVRVVPNRLDKELAVLVRG